MPEDEVNKTEAADLELECIVVKPEPMTKRPMGMFSHPGFQPPADFDDLPEEDLRVWEGEEE